MIPLKYATASQEIPLGTFLDSTNGDDEETTLTIANTDIRLWKSGATSRVNKNAGGATHMDKGEYYAVLDDTDTNTYGPMKVTVHVAGALVVVAWCLVMEANAYDALMAALGTGYVESNVKYVDDVVLAAQNLALQFDGTGITGDNFPAFQAQLNNIANVGSAINVVAGSDTLTTGTETSGTVADTETLNQVYHQISDDTGEIEIYYEFNVGGDGVPVLGTWIGRMNEGAPVNSDIIVYAYNWAGTSWDQVWTLAGKLSTADQTETFDLFTSHVGTGADLGKVRIRFFDDGLSSGDTELYTDQIFVSYSVVNRSIGYANGEVWIDTVNGVAGTVSYINGTADNPVDSLADAITIAAAIGVNRFHVAQGSSLTFIGTMDNYEFDGIDYTIAFGGQQVDNSVIKGANLSGIATGNGGSLLLLSCQFKGATTIPEIAAIDCAMAATVTLGEAGDYIFERCFSAIAGSGAPILDAGAAIGNQNINFRHYSGGIDLRNFGAAGTDTMSLEGHGQLIIGADCGASNISIRGHFTITDNASGAVTLSDDARFDVDQVEDAADAALITYDGPTHTEMTAEHDVLEAEHVALSGEHDLLATEAKQDTMQGNVTDILEDTDTTLPGEHALLATEAKQDSAQTDITAIKAKTDNLPEGIKKNQAFTLSFTMIDENDNITPLAGLTVAGSRSIDGVSFTGVSGSVSEISNGWYYFEGLAADSNGTEIAFLFSATGADNRDISVKTSL